MGGLLLGGRGRLTIATHRPKARGLIDGANAAGAGLESACREIGICPRTTKRWRKAFLGDGDSNDRCKCTLRHVAHRPPLPAKLSALSDRSTRGPTEAERKNLVFRRSIYVAEDIAEGEEFTSSNLPILRPGNGAPPSMLKYWDQCETSLFQGVSPLCFPASSSLSGSPFSANNEIPAAKKILD